MIDPTKENEVIIADGTSVIIPVGTIENKTNIEITNVPEVELNGFLPPAGSGTKGVGIYRRIERDCEVINWQNAPTEEVPLRFPLEIEEYVKIYPKSLIVVAGKSDEIRIVCSVILR